MDDRNFNAEMITLINRALPKNGEFTSGSVAEKLIAALEEADPELLTGWLIMNSRSILTDYISDLLGNRRRAVGHQRRQAERSVFSDAVREYEAGNKMPLESWLDQTYVVDEDFTRKRLAEMTKSDLLFVERQYEASIRHSGLEKAFVSALARRVPNNKTVGEVWSEDKIEALRQSIAA